MHEVILCDFCNHGGVQGGEHHLGCGELEDIDRKAPPVEFKNSPFYGRRCSPNIPGVLQCMQCDCVTVAVAVAVAVAVTVTVNVTVTRS